MQLIGFRSTAPKNERGEREMGFDARKLTKVGALLVLGAAMLIVGISPASAIPICPAAFPQCGSLFTVNEASVPGVPGNPGGFFGVTANAINFDFNSSAKQPANSLPKVLPGAPFTETGAASASGLT